MAILQKSLDIFRAGDQLPSTDSEQFFDALIAETDERLLADLLTAWETKGTTEDEIFSLASIMRDRCTRVETKHATFVDVVGTGGSKAKTFNVSTAASFVIAGAGLPVAKHGNRAATSKSGSADVLSELGVNPAVDAESARKCLDEIGVCFMFAPNFHSLSPILAKVRRGLGFPTIFNCLGPICNPANPPHQLIGVWKEDMVEKTARVLARLGTKRSWIVHGENGLDEITLTGKTDVSEISDGEVKTFKIKPDDFGLQASKIDGLHKNSPAESAKLIRSVLDGSCEHQAASNLVIINAAAPIYLSGHAANLIEAAGLAAKSIQSGAALKKLEELAEAANR